MNIMTAKSGGGMRATKSVDSCMQSNAGAEEGLTLRGVLIHEDLSKSLVSVAMVADEGHTIVIDSVKALVVRGKVPVQGDVIMTAPRSGNLYLMPPTEALASVALAEAEEKQSERDTLGHALLSQAQVSKRILLSATY